MQQSSRLPGAWNSSTRAADKLPLNALPANHLSISNPINQQEGESSYAAKTNVRVVCSLVKKLESIRLLNAFKAFAMRELAMSLRSFSA